MIRYYIIDNDRKGKRLFRHDEYENKVVQVVVHPGKKKTGRAKQKGVYIVSEATLKCNYLWKIEDRFGEHIKYTSKKLFEYYANKVVHELLNECDNG